MPMDESMGAPSDETTMMKRSLPQVQSSSAPITYLTTIGMAAALMILL